MVELFARQSDLDAMRQQFQSDPSSAFPFLRGVPQVVDRSYLGIAGPAADTWDTFYLYSGRGGMLYPDRQFEARLIMAASNFSGGPLYWLARATLGTTVFWEAEGLLLDGESQNIIPTFRIIATGGNSGQLIEVGYGGGAPDLSTATENLAGAMALRVEATWRDYDGGGGYEDFLTPTNDAYFYRYHAVAVLT